MKVWLTAILSLLTSLASLAAEKTADLKIYSISIMVLPATFQQFGLEYKMEVTTASETEPANGELMIAPDEVPYTHTGTFLLEEPTTFEKIPMDFLVDVPGWDDLNSNDTPDFFEVEQSASGTTEGLYWDWMGDPNEFTATWARNAGEYAGTVTTRFPDLGLTFRHPFVLLQYNGTFTYTRTGNQITGNVSLARVDNPPDTLTGPWTINVSAANELSWSSAHWLTSDQLQMDLGTVGSMSRLGLVFSDIFVVNDGYFATAMEDYDAWFLALTSTDANGNSIPDLIEVDQTPVDPPSLQAAKVDGTIQLTITGTSGQVYTLEKTDSLPASQWNTVQLITLASTPNVLTFPLETGPLFFRLKQ